MRIHTSHYERGNFIKTNERMDEKKEINKPGAMALMAIKNQKKSAVVFKKPAEPVVRKKTKNVILTEEKYMEVSDDEIYFENQKQLRRIV